MTDALVKRLEAVASRLEAFASSCGSTPAAPCASSAGSSSSSGPSAALAAFDAFYSSSVQPFIDATNKFDGIKHLGVWTEKSFKHARLTLEASEQSRKPGDEQFAKFLDPIIKIINESAAFNDNRDPFFNQKKAFAEAIAHLSWLCVNTPRAVIKDQLEAADFFMNKVLLEGKKKGGKEGEDISSFATSLKNLLNKELEFVGAHYKTGLEFNPKGGDINSFKSGGSAPAAPCAPGAPSAPCAPGAPAPPCAPSAPSAPCAPGVPPCAPGAPAPSSGSGGMESVFAQIRGGGDGITGGLKKVTSDMKSKNLKHVPVKEPQGPTKAAPAAEKKAAAPAEKKEPKLFLNKGTWFCEHHEGDTLTIPNVQLKENVYIMKCKNITITIPDKCKSIAVDNCSKITVIFKSVVSIFECFNSQSVTIECTECFPSVSIDKSHGCAIVLNRIGVKTPPTMVTSNITELNLVVPGKTDEDDPVEIPLPQQYLTTFVNGKLITEPVTHGSN